MATPSAVSKRQQSTYLIDPVDRRQHPRRKHQHQELGKCRAQQKKKKRPTSKPTTTKQPETTPVLRPMLDVVNTNIAAMRIANTNRKVLLSDGSCRATTASTRTDVNSALAAEAAADL